MKTRDSKILLAETDNTTEHNQRAKQSNLSSGLTQPINNLIFDDTASYFQVLPPPKEPLSTPRKRINCTRYLLLNISEKLKLDMTSGAQTSMIRCAPNQYGPTRNLHLYCLK